MAKICRALALNPMPKFHKAVNWVAPLTATLVLTQMHIHLKVITDFESKDSL